MTFTYKFGRRLLLSLVVLSMLLLTVAAFAQAQGNEVNERIPLTGLVFNSCTGEEILTEGTFHLVSNRTRDQSGTVHLQEHWSFTGHGVSSSGAKYTVNGVTSGHETRGENSAYNNTYTTHLHFIRQGESVPTDDFMVHATFHLTWNANGEYTATVVEVRHECR